MLQKTKLNFYKFTNRKFGFGILGLIILICNFFWWESDRLWERLWLGMIPLLILLLTLHITYILLCYMLCSEMKKAGLIFLAFLVLLPFTEYFTYRLVKYPPDDYYIRSIKKVANLDLPRNIEIISKGGVRPDVNGHYHYTFTATLPSKDYWDVKKHLLNLKHFNDTSNLKPTETERRLWQIHSHFLSQNLRILDVEGSLDVKLIDAECTMVFLFNDI